MNNYDNIHIMNELKTEQSIEFRKFAAVLLHSKEDAETKISWLKNFMYNQDVKYTKTEQTLDWEDEE